MVERHGSRRERTAKIKTRGVYACEAEVWLIYNETVLQTMAVNSVQH